MSQTSVSMASRRAVRVAVAAVVAVALLAPATFLFSRVWDAGSRTLEFHRAERRGLDYLGPLTDLLGVVTREQSVAVGGGNVDAAAVRSAVADVDAVDARLGGSLRTTERWTAVRRTIEDRVSRGWPEPEVAYQQWSDLTTALLELTAKVADVSDLLLDPRPDAHHLAAAAAQGIPRILVDSGRHLDLAVLAAGRDDADTVARLTTARDRIATGSADLFDAFLVSFAATGSTTLAQGLTPLLDGFRTAVARVAPSTSLVATPPRRTAEVLAGDQTTLRSATLALHGAAVIELDRLLAARESAASRGLAFSVLAYVLVAVLVVGSALAFVVLMPDAAPGDGDGAEDEEEPVPASPDGRLVAASTAGGARAAR